MLQTCRGRHPVEGFSRFWSQSQKAARPDSTQVLVCQVTQETKDHRRTCRVERKSGKRRTSVNELQPRGLAGGEGGLRPSTWIASPAPHQALCSGSTAMKYLAHSAHAQLGAFWLSCVGWVLTAMALGLIQWRVWLVSDRGVISSGVAWVGVWRACFNSHTLVTPGFRVMHCRYIRLAEAFAPPEIVAAQVLMILSLVVGLCGNAGGVYALRNIYFGTKESSPIRSAFFTTGVLCLLAAVMSLTPLLWNLISVVTNQTIEFPPEFNMPPAPDSQHVGCGIGVGMVGTVLMVVSGIIFCMYRLPVRSQRPGGSSTAPSVSGSRGAAVNDNPAFESPEHL